MQNSASSIATGIAWCLAWGEGREPQFDINVLWEMRRALNAGEEVPAEVKQIVDRVQQLQAIDKDYFPATLDELKSKYPELWNQETKIGLVYGGATKIKQYVFEAAKLPDIRGASALLDRINLVDLPAFFGEPKKSVSVSEWLNESFPNLETALIKELLVYYKGGNILAFCPAAFVYDLADAIEKRYSYETLTANSCAVGESFRVLEIRFGLLKQNIENTPWLDWYHQNYTQPLVQAYFGFPTNELERIQKFKNHKSFNELTTKLAVLFNQRRSGNDFPNRPSRRYPPMFETHPYLRRDESDRRSAIARISSLPGNPSLSESLVRKRIMGQIAKGEVLKDNLPNWFINLHLDWQPTGVESWVTKFDHYLDRRENSQLANDYGDFTQIQEARSLREIGNASKGFVAYIYADGNNMGGYIQQIQTPQEYKKFSEDIFQATEKSVYKALAQHLKPHQLNNLTDPDNEKRNGCWIHPFEILAIGGDDVMLIVPADRALAIAKTIGEEFENILLQTGGYRLDNNRPSYSAHRYSPEKAIPSECKLSMSVGVLITAEDTPIYYAQNLTNQLLKSAKKTGKKLKKDAGYFGGTIDFLVMKSVTMISSNIESFRDEGLTLDRGAKLKLYAAPYTLHEIGGLLESVKVLKKAEFPKSQLYQIRSFLERGKQTTILNYRYFRTRLKQGKAELKAEFEDAWCKPKNPENSGNLAPWMFDLKEGVYETIWRELVDIYDFIEEDSKPISEDLANMEVDS